jgi:hypothetical protein
MHHTHSRLRKEPHEYKQKANSYFTGIPYTLLRLPSFIDNTWGSAGSIKAQGQFYGPVNPDQLVSQVVAADIGEAVAAVLAHPTKHAGARTGLNLVNMYA